MNSVPQLSIYSTGSECAHHIAILQAKLFNAPWGQEFLERLLNRKTNLSFVAHFANKDEIVGFLLGSLAADEAEILTLGVDKQFQRLGIASKLLSAFLQELKDKRAKRAFLEVSIDNLAAERLYKKYGFEFVGQRRKYYEKCNSSNADAAIMSLCL